MTDTMQATAGDDREAPRGKTFAQLREELDVAVMTAETIPCEESWARVETLRLALAQTREVRYARTAINQRAVHDESRRRNIPGANCW